MRRLTLAIAAAAGILVTGCLTFTGSDAPTVGEARETRPAPALETVATGLEVPWDLAFAPDGRIFVTERPGRIRVVDEDGRLLPEPWAELDVTEVGEAGLLSIALSPGFEDDGHVYVVGTFIGQEDQVNRIVRLTDRAGEGTEATVIVDSLPTARFHAGATLAFGPDGMLWHFTGDARRPTAARNPESLAGKLLRYRPDGTVPPDNPVPDSPVYALGLRNPQGMDWHPRTGDLFAVEHGPSGFPNEEFRTGDDELNVVRPGGDYGWPEVAGMPEADAESLAPIRAWNPAIAPGGLAIYTGDRLPWGGDLLVGALRGTQLRRVTVEPASETAAGWRVTGEEVLFHEQVGRIRTVEMAPDGELYFTTSNRDGRGDPGPEDDRILRVVPGGAGTPASESP